MYAKTKAGTSENPSTYNKKPHLHIYRSQKKSLLYHFPKRKNGLGKVFDRRLYLTVSSTGIVRFIELSRDEFGIQRVVTSCSQNERMDWEFDRIYQNLLLLLELNHGLKDVRRTQHSTKLSYYLLDP